jgi:hypothetical protein
MRLLDRAVSQKTAPLGCGLYHDPLSRFRITVRFEGIDLDWFLTGLSHGKQEH